MMNVGSFISRVTPTGEKSGSYSCDHKVMDAIYFPGVIHPPFYYSIDQSIDMIRMHGRQSNTTEM